MVKVRRFGRSSGSDNASYKRIIEKTFCDVVVT